METEYGDVCVCAVLLRMRMCVCVWIEACFSMFFLTPFSSVQFRLDITGSRQPQNASKTHMNRRTKQKQKMFCRTESRIERRQTIAVQNIVYRALFNISQIVTAVWLLDVQSHTVGC